jgi:hypothetical protein
VVEADGSWVEEANCGIAYALIFRALRTGDTLLDFLRLFCYIGSAVNLSTERLGYFQRFSVHRVNFVSVLLLVDCQSSTI